MAEIAAEDFHQFVTLVSGLRQHRSEGLGERQGIMLGIGGVQAGVLRLLKLDHIYTGAGEAPDRSDNSSRAQVLAQDSLGRATTMRATVVSNIPSRFRPSVPTCKGGGRDLLTGCGC